MSAPSIHEPPDVALLGGWQTPLLGAECPYCGSLFLVQEARLGATCPDCCAASLRPHPGPLPQASPETLVPFGVPSDKLGQALMQWMRGVWLRPPEMNQAPLLSRLTRSYLPLWLVDGQVTGHWSAQVGYDYQVASSQEHYQNGTWTTRSLTETRIRWEPRLGEIDRRYHNIMAPALQEHATLMVLTGPYATDAAQPYHPEALDGVVRLPDLLPEAAWPQAQKGFEQEAAAECCTAAGAQHVENYTLHANYQIGTWTLLLLPLYTTFYHDEQGRVMPVLINGQTGKVSGERWASQRAGWRWTGGVALLALLLGMVAGVILGVLSPEGGELWGLGIVLLALSGLLLLLAPIPALWAWQFNRRAQG